MNGIIQVYHNDAETLQNICRVDFIGRRIGGIKRTDEGYLTGSAPIAKIGILTYFLGNGSTRRELVNEDTLFNPKSMATLRMKPITDQHPPEKALDAKTVKRRKVGFTGENIKRDGDFLLAPVTVTDDDAVTNIDQGRRELSPGYRCDLLLVPGEFNGQRYDGVQLNRHYNHVAICDRARGGSDLKLHLDKIDHLDGFEINEDVLGMGAGVGNKRQGAGGVEKCKCPSCGYEEEHDRGIPCMEKICPKCDTKMVGKNSAENSLNKDELKKLKILLNKGKGLYMPQFNVDGINYDAAQEVVNFAKKETVRADAAEIKFDTAEKKVVELQTKIDALEGERDGLKTKVDELGELDHTDAITKGVQERITVLDAVDAVVLKDKVTEMKIDELSNMDLKKAVILEKSPEAKLDGRTDDYLNARFDAIFEGIKFDSDAANNQRRKISQRFDSTGDVVEKARKDSEDRIQNNYKNLGGRAKE